jgi:hypothetical protein
MVAFINSVVGGAGVALLVDAIVGGDPVGLGLVCGIVAVAGSMLAFLVFQRWRFSTIDATSPEPIVTKGTGRDGDV